MLLRFVIYYSLINKAQWIKNILLKQTVVMRQGHCGSQHHNSPWSIWVWHSVSHGLKYHMFLHGCGCAGIRTPTSSWFWPPCCSLPGCMGLQSPFWLLLLKKKAAEQCSVPASKASILRMWKCWQACNWWELLDEPQPHYYMWLSIKMKTSPQEGYSF